MAEKLTTVKEPKVKVSGLTYNNIVSDVYNLIKDNPLLEENITDYTSADSVRMLTEMFAWITDQLSQRLDIIGNELFLETAENRENIVRLLKIIGYDLDFPECANAKFDIKVINFDDKTEENIVLSEGVLGEGDSILLTENSFKKVDHSLSGRTFELIVYDEVKKVYDYFSPLSIVTREVNRSKTFYEGRTSSLSFRVDTNGFFTKDLPVSVIKNSVRIFYTEKIDGEIVELKQVSNFFGPETVYSELPVYKISNLGGGHCRITFPSSKDVNERNLLRIGDEITVLYRTGGGSEGNIGSGELVSTQEIWLNNGLRRGYLDIRNTTRAIGGKSELNIEEMRVNAPQEIKNRLSAVTSLDYEYILKKENSEIKDIKVYGENNLPSEADIIGTYGFARNPLDVWLFIIKENVNYSHNILEVTDFINDIPFQTLDLNERMNEIYQINRADLNVSINTGDEFKGEGSINISGDTINQYYSIPIPFRFLEELESEKENNQSNIRIAVTKEEFRISENDITGENSDVEFLLEDSYYLDEGTPVNRKTLMYDGNNIAPLYENLDPVMEHSINESDMFGGELEFTFNGEEREINIEENTDLESLLKELNLHMNLYLNGSYPSVILKNNIDNINEDSGLYGNVSIEITASGETEIYTFNANNESWNDLVEKIKEAENAENELITEKYKCAILDKTYDGEECKILVLFTESPNINKFTLTCVKLGLENVESTGIVRKSTDDEYETDLKTYFTYEDGILTFINYNYESGDILFTSNELFQKLFGIGSSFLNDGKFILKSRRVMTILENGNLIVEVPSPKYALPNEIFISGLWGTNNEIRLGSFYEEIEDNSKFEAPAEVKSLLKRNPLKNLYNSVAKQQTKFSTNSDIIDIYNSKYEVKITRSKANNRTYFQIGNSEEYPEVSFSTSSSLDTTISGNLYIKVNGEKYTVGGIEVEDGTNISIDITTEDSSGQQQTITDYATTNNGFAVFNMAKFSGRSISAFTDALLEVLNFDEDVVDIVSKGDKIILRCLTNNYYSGLDFGNTSSDLMYTLFGLTGENILIPSPETYIDLKKIDFLKFSLTEGSFKPREYIKLSTNGKSSEIFTGNNLEEFIINLRTDQQLKDEIAVEGNDIFLLNRNEGAFFTITIENEEESVVESMKRMFYETRNEAVEEGVGYYVSVTKTVDGDYYIDKIGENFMFVPVRFTSFPLGNLYFHMLEDYRIDHIYGEEDGKDYTDEHAWNKMIENKKMLCVSHVFRQPKFIPFSAIINVKISRNVSFGKRENYSNKIYNALFDRYNIYESVLGEDVFITDIERFIKNISGVVDAEVEYLGFKPNEPLTSLRNIPAKFNEKLILSSKKEETVHKGDYLFVEPIQGLFVKVEYIK